MFVSVGDFLAEFKKKFGGDNELAKVAELKQLNKIHKLWMNLSRCSKKQHKVVICKSTHPETTSPQWSHLQNIQACLPWWPPFSQHISWWCCNHPGIPSSTVEILLFNLVFYDRVTPVSVSTLKPPLRVIGVFPLKP